MTRALAARLAAMACAAGLCSVSVAQQPTVRVVSSAEDSAWRSQQARTRPYTREEMLNATSLDVAAVSEDRIQGWGARQAAGIGYDTRGGPSSIAGGGPAGSEAMISSAVPFEAMALTEDSSAIQQTGYAYPAPFTRYEAFPSYQIYPYQTVGRVFFNIPGRGTFACSASSVGGDGVMTAGHCVHDAASNTFWNHWVFVPGYKNGAAPYGQWTANRLFVLTAYQDGDQGDERFDVGGAVLNRVGGKRISEKVGFLGFQWNMSNTATSAHWALLGYPAAAPFTGGQQFVCQASFAYTFGPPSPSPIGVGCDQTGGTSGGPWIRSFSGAPGKSNYLNGVNVFRRCFDPLCNDLYTQELFSPYFDNNAKKLHDCVVKSAPGAPAPGC
ncbi:MAG: hypothetical protein ABI609_06420 [Acidobacteriota bacterium]